MGQIAWIPDILSAWDVHNVDSFGRGFFRLFWNNSAWIRARIWPSTIVMMTGMFTRFLFIALVFMFFDTVSSIFHFSFSADAKITKMSIQKFYNSIPYYLVCWWWCPLSLSSKLNRLCFTDGDPASVTDLDLDSWVIFPGLDKGVSDFGASPVLRDFGVVGVTSGVLGSFPPTFLMISGVENSAKSPGIGFGGSFFFLGFLSWVLVSSCLSSFFSFCSSPSGFASAGFSGSFEGWKLP